MATQIGIVKTLTGEVTATAADGSIRTLQVGDRVYANELISTGQAGALEIEFSDGSIMDLGRNSQAMLDSAVFDPSSAVADASEEDVPDDVAAIQQALLEGEDPTEVGEATAAGAGVQGGNEGHDAVFVNYLNPEVTPDAGFETIGVNSEVDDYEDEQLLDGQPTAGLVSVLLDEDDLNFFESFDFVQNLLDQVRSEFQADTNLNIDNQPDAGARNTTSPGDDFAPSATFFSGTLNANFGSDGPGSITFNAAGTQPSGLTSGGQPVQIWVSADGLTLIGYVASDDDTFSTQRASIDQPQFDGADLIFSAQITDLETYAFEAGLFGPIDHPDSVEDGAFEENLLLNIAFTITDADGDAAQGIIQLNVDDDSPVIGEQLPQEQSFLRARVQEESQSSANADEDDSPNGVGNTDSDGDDAVTSITLPINFGADGPAAESPVEFSTDSITDQNGNPLTSNGVALEFNWNASTNTLEGTANGEPVINIHVDVTDLGFGTSSVVSIQLFDNLDHPIGAEGESLGTEDNLNISLNYTATDADGDQASGSVSVSIDDDMPVIGTPDTVSVDEEGINGNAGDSYASGGIATDGDSLTVSGAIESVGEGFVTVDRWTFQHNGGPVNIDVLSEVLGGDLDGSGSVEGVDPVMHLFAADDLSTPLNSSDDNPAPDPALSIADLPAGEYVIAISDWPFGSGEATSDTQESSSDFFGNGNAGPYQITFTGDLTITAGPDGTLGGDLPGEETSATGSLAIDWGADNNNDAESEFDRSVTFTDQAAPEGLTADGEPVSYSISEDGTVLTAFTGEPETESYSEVFTVTLSDEESGSYEFNLLGNLDHPEANTEDDIDLSFDFIATDSDGDSATASFNVTVDDDAPVITAEQPEVAFELNVTNNNEVSSAGYNSSYGYYIKSETGEPTDGMIIWNNVQDPANESATVTIEGFSPDQIGFFIIPNGFNNNSGLENETEVTFEQDGNGHWQAVVDGEVLNGSGSNVLFDVAALNNDGQDHVQDNALAGNQNWEDLQIPTGDGDYNDVNVNVEFSRVGGITVDETDIGTGDPSNATATIDFSGSFISSFGADGAGEIEYTLSVDTEVETGLVDTLSGKAVELRVNDDGEVEGYITTDDNLELVVFTASVDEDGEVTLTQTRAVEHDDATDPDEALSPATINAGAIALSATITDADGDSADASLDLGVLFAFEDDGPSVDRNPVARVDDDVFDGNEGGIGDGPDANFVSGTLGHDFGQDGTGSIAWSTDVSLAPNLDGFTFENGTNEGELLIKQDGETVLTLTLNSETGEYTVTQNAVIDHKDARNENNQNFEVTYIVTDGDGDTTEGLLKISVDDDTPTIDKASHLSVQEADVDNDGFDVIEANGQLSHIKEGADGATVTSMSLQASADFNTLRVGGEEVVASQTGNVITVNTVGGEPVFELTYNSDGEYTYKQFQAFDHQNDNPNRDNSEIIKLGFSFIVTDGDGDTAEGSLIVTVNDDEPVARYSSINVAELDADNDGEFDVIQQVQQAFNFDQGADGAEVTAIEMHNVKADGTVNIWNGGGADVFTLSSGGENIIVTEDGTTITGTVGENGPTAFTIELNNDGTYTYTQYQPLDHAQTPNGQADNQFTLSFKYTVTDADGDTDQAYVGINIEDDVPSVGSASHLSVQETDTDNDGFDVIEANGQLSNITEGADGATVTSMSLQASADFNTLRVGGEEVVASQTGNVITVDTVGGEPVFELTYNSDGEYTYKQFQAFDHQNDNPNRDNSEIIKLGFNFIVTDADGDTAEGSLIVTVNDDEPVFTQDTGVTITHDESANAQNEAPEITWGQFFGLPYIRDIDTDPNNNGNELFTQIFGNGEMLGVSVNADTSGIIYNAGADGLNNVALTDVEGNAFNGADSGLQTSNGDQPIYLYTLNGSVFATLQAQLSEIGINVSDSDFGLVGDNIVVGLTNDGGLEQYGSLAEMLQDSAFLLGLKEGDNGDGSDDTLALMQLKAIEHADTADADDEAILDQIHFSVTDNDGDTVTSESAIEVIFEDDGPKVDVGKVNEAAQQLEVTLDETVGDDRAADGESVNGNNDDVDGALAQVTTQVAGGLTALFTISGSAGADSPATDSGELSLQLSDEGLATTLSATDGGAISLFSDVSGNIVGRDEAGDDVFTIEIVDINGETQLQTTLFEAIEHGNTSSFDEALELLTQNGNLELQYEVTRTDADGDSDTDSASIALANPISSAISFEDDGPAITVEQPAQPYLLTITNEGGDAGYNNTYGYFIKGENGEPVSGEIIWANVKANVSGEITIQDSHVTDPSDIGFFIIPNGDVLNELNNGDAVTFEQDGDDWQVVLDGEPLSGQGTNVLFNDAALNPEDAQAMQDNAAAGNQNWEDIIGGDNDFNDVNINVSFTRTGTLTMDETVGERESDPNAADEQGTQASGAIGYASVSADQLFSFHTDGGADGEDESLREYNLALNFENEGDTEVGSGLSSHDGEILLSYDNGDVIGHDGEDEVFRISMNADGDVTVTQFKAIDHGELGSDGDAAVFMDSGVLAGELTIFDNDGDSASAQAELGQQIAFEDDAPSADDDSVTVVAGQSVEGNVFDNDDAGQDEPLTLTGIQHGDETYSFENADSDEDGLYITVDADNGTLKIYDNGEYIYIADQPAQGTVNVPDNSLNDWQGAVGIFAFDGGLPMSDGDLDTDNLSSNADVEFQNGDKGGLGVKSDQQSSSIDAGESLLISLNGETTSATVGINAMNVGQSDQGKWTAYNADGEEVGSGTFNGVHNNGKEFTIDINTNESFSYISFGDNPDSNSSQGYYVSSLSYQGMDENVDGEEFIYTAVDADGTPTEAKLSINVNNPPEVSDTSGEGVGNEDEAIEVSLLATDDDSVESFVIKSVPDNGTLFVGDTEVSTGMSVAATSGEATVTFVPNQDWSDNNGDAPVTFEYVAVDNHGVESEPATATVEVAPVTDTPEVSIMLTPDQVTELFATDLSNVLNNSEDQVGYPEGFSVTALKLDGGDWVETGISVKDTGSPTGFGVAGNGGSNGADSEIENGEKLLIQLDTPASSITFQLAWLNGSNETAEYTLTYDDGSTETFSIFGGSDRVDPPVTKDAPEGKTITAIEFATPTDGNRVTTSDYLVHSVSYAAALMTYSVDIAAEATDMDGSESITQLTVTTPEGVTLSDSQFIETVDGQSTWSLYVDELSNDSNDYSSPTVNVSTDGEVTVSGLTLTVPSDFDGDLVVSAEATANEPGAATPESATAITGDVGDNELMGTDGVDILFGGEGDDILVGGADNDILIGGADNDTLTGGDGADIFQWNDGDEGTTDNPAVDVVTDFNASEGDVLDLADLLDSDGTNTIDATNLDDYLKANFDSVEGTTTVEVYTNGDANSGGQSTQNIVLNGEFTQQDLTNLLNNNNLDVDQS
jgi:T1SS-143 domain-containing protein